MNMMIQGLSFDWIPFPHLGGLGRREIYGTPGRFDRFNCVDNRFGVYLFIDESLHVHYVGMSGRDPVNQERSMKDRISQHFQPGDSGGSFRDCWYKRNGFEKNDHNFWCEFGPYIENLKLITLSTVRTDPDTINPEILKDIERFFICKFEPEYNETIFKYLTSCEHFKYLTSCEQNELLSEFKNLSTL